MQAIINKFLSAEDIGQSSIYNMIPVALSNVPFHRNTKSITRYFAKRFPLHLAVHQVSPVLEPLAQYTDPHLHEYTDEINIIISKKNLFYKIQLGDDEYTVSNNSCIWIPRGMIHDANVLNGSGYFISMRLN